MGFLLKIAQNPIMQKIGNIFTPDVLNGIFALILGISIFYIYKYREEHKKTKRLTIIEALPSVKTKKEKRPVKIEYFKSLKKACSKYFELNEKKRYMADYYYYGILAIEIILFIICFSCKKPIFAFVLPPIVHIFAIKILGYLTVDIHTVVFSDLSNAIKHMVKIFSKTSDLKLVLYETSKELRDPLRTLFFNLSRKMLSENYEKCLNDFADELDDIWIYAFVFLLISYKEQSRKEDIMKNLRTLADILDKENYIRQKALTDKKPIAVMNYLLLISGIVAFVGNLFLNDKAVNFFFNTIGGMFAVVLGVCAAFITVIINLILTHKTERG